MTYLWQAVKALVIDWLISLWAKVRKSKQGAK